MALKTKMSDSIEISHDGSEMSPEELMANWKSILSKPYDRPFRRYRQRTLDVNRLNLKESGLSKFLANNKSMMSKWWKEEPEGVTLVDSCSRIPQVHNDLRTAEAPKGVHIHPPQWYQTHRWTARSAPQFEGLAAIAQEAPF